MKLRQRRMIILGMHRRVDDAGRDCVETDVVRRVLQRQRFAHRRHGRLRQHRQQSGRGAARLIREDRRDVHHMPRILLLHLRNHLLRHVEEAGDVGIHHQIVFFFGVVGERLRKEDPGVVDQQIDATEVLEGCFHHLGGGFLLADLSIHEDDIGRRLELLRLGDGAGGADDAPATFEERLGQAQTDSAGSASDDGDRSCLHDNSKSQPWIDDIEIFRVITRQLTEIHRRHGSPIFITSRNTFVSSGGSAPESGSVAERPIARFDLPTAFPKRYSDPSWAKILLGRERNGNSNDNPEL